MDDLLTLNEAAELLGVIRRRAQALVSQRQLVAVKRGVQWFVPAASVRDYQHNSPRRAGRPLTAHRAWAEISALTPDLDLSELDRIRRRVRPRADHRSYFVHPGLHARLAADVRLVLTGRNAAANLPVDADGVDAYVRSGDLGGLLADFHATEDVVGGNVHLHIVDDQSWPFSNDRVADRWVVWLDLADRQDRAADLVLDSIIGGRRRA